MPDERLFWAMMRLRDNAMAHGMVDLALVYGYSAVRIALDVLRAREIQATPLATKE